MTRDNAIDVLWSAMMLTLPIGAGLPNTDEDRRAARTMIAVFSVAMEAVGVTVDEMTAAQRRYETTIGALHDEVRVAK